MKSLIVPVILACALCIPAVGQSQMPASNDMMHKAHSTEMSSAETAKVIVVINSADWCGVCKANGPRVEKNVVSTYMMNSDYQIVMNNLTDDSTKAMSKEMLTKAGIAEFGAKHKATGMIYFLNAENKKVISSISVSKSNEEIKKAFVGAVSQG
jgi:hypothetical protein